MNEQRKVINMNSIWNNYKSTNGNIDLISFFTEEENVQNLPGFVSALEFLRNVEKNQRIKSGQVAAIAVAQALYIAQHPITGV